MRFFPKFFMSALIASCLSLTAITIANAQTTFANATPITIPGSGTATPYPSTINVSGLTGAITGVTVTLTGFSHTYADDVDILLVGPQGQTVALAFGIGTGQAANNLTWTFSDSAATLLPNDATALVSGTFRPSNYYPGDVLSAPAPGGPYGTLLSAYNGTLGNGAWRLFAQDFAAGDSGSISGGWSVTITTPPVTVPEPTTLALLGMGLIGSIGIVRRRRK